MTPADRLLDEPWAAKACSDIVDQTRMVIVLRERTLVVAALMSVDG